MTDNEIQSRETDDGAHDLVTPTGHTWGRAYELSDGVDYDRAHGDGWRYRGTYESLDEVLDVATAEWQDEQ